MVDKLFGMVVLTICVLTQQLDFLKFFEGVKFSLTWSCSTLL